MINYLSINGRQIYGITNYVMDTEADLENLPTNVPMGSTAFCIGNSTVYMINSEGKWVAI